MKLKTWAAPSQSDIARFNAGVSRTEDCLLWVKGIFPSGYGAMVWRGKNWRAHRLALVWASGGVERVDHYALHSCRNRNCCLSLHLRWGDAKENAADRAKDKTQHHGSQVHISELCERDAAVAYREYHEQGHPASHIAKRYGVSPRTIQQIASGNTWTRVTKDIVLEKRRKISAIGRMTRARPLDEKTVKKVWSMWHEEKVTQDQIMKETGITTGSVRQILRRKTYTDITEAMPFLRPSRTNKGTPQKKRDGKRTRITHDQIKEIWHMRHSEGIQQTIVAEMFGIPWQIVFRIATGQAWVRYTKNLICKQGKNCILCMKSKNR